jgi:hypothetical protein
MRRFSAQMAENAERKYFSQTLQIISGFRGRIGFVDEDQLS